MGNEKMLVRPVPDCLSTTRSSATDRALPCTGTNYAETLRVQVHANCRLRRVYFSDRLYSEDELPAEFKLYSR